MDINQLINLLGMILAIFFMTTLYGKKNPFFSLAISLMLGTSLAYLLVYTITKIYSDSFLELINGNYLQIIPLMLGLLLLTTLVPKYSYLSKIPIAITAGTTLAMTTRTIIFTEILGFSKSAITPLFTETGLYNTFINLTTLIFTVTILTFFVYTLPKKGALNASATIGEYALYAALGGFLANSFFSYNATTLGVLTKYLKADWGPYPFIITCIVVFAVIVFLDRKNLLEKYAE